MEKLFGSETVRFIFQIIVYSIAITGAYYKIQNNIETLRVRIDEIEKDRTTRWCAFDATDKDHHTLLAKMSTDIEVIKTKIEIYLQNNNNISRS